MPLVNGKYVSPPNNKLESINSFLNASQSYANSAKGQFAPSTKKFNGYVTEYQDYIDNPESISINADWEELRALGQSNWQRLGNGGMKFLGNAGIGILDGTVGTVAGIMNTFGEKSGVKGNLSEFINNPVSVALGKLRDSMEENFQNFETKEYKNTSALGSIFSMQGFADNLLASAGHAVGAIAPGALAAKGLNYAGKLGVKLFAKQIGKNWDEFVELAAKEGVESAVKQMPNIALKKQIWNTSKAFIGSAVSAMGEARMEASDSSKAVIENLKQQGVWDTLTEQEREEIKADTEASVFTANLALLTASNFVQFGKLFGGKYSANRLKYNLAIKAGEFVAKPNLSYIPKAIVKGFLPEGAEELGQFFVSESAKHYNTYRAIDPESQDFIKSLTYGFNRSNSKEGWQNFFSGAILGGIMPNFSGDSSAKTTGIGKALSKANFFGGLKDALKEGTELNSRSSKAAIDLNEKAKSALQFKVGSQIEELKALLDSKTSLTKENAQKIQNLRNSVLSSLSLEIDSNKAIKAGDKKKSIDYEQRAFGIFASALVEYGVIDDFVQDLQDVQNINIEELKSLFSEKVVEEDASGKQKVIKEIDPTYTKDAETILNEHKKQAQQKIEDIKKIRNIFNKIDSVTDGKLELQSKSELATQVYFAGKLDERAKKLKDKIVSAVSFKENIEVRKNGISQEDKDLLTKAFGKEVAETFNSQEAQINLQSLIEDLTSSDTTKRNKAKEILKSLVAGKTFEDIIDSSDGISTKELVQDIQDLSEITKDRKELGEIIKQAYNNPKEFNKVVKNIINTFEKSKGLEEDNMATMFPFFNKYKEGQKAIEVIREYFNTWADEQTQINKGSSSITEEDKINANSIWKAKDDRTPYTGWQTFIKSIFQQTKVDFSIPNQMASWAIFIYNPKYNKSKYTYITQTANTIRPELKSKLKFFIPSLNDSLTVEEIEKRPNAEALKKEADENILIVVFDKVNNTFLEINGANVAVSISDPTIEYNRETGASEKNRFDYKHVEEYVRKNLVNPTEEQVRIEVEAHLLADINQYKKWRAEIQQKPYVLTIKNINPGAKAASSSLVSPKGSVVESSKFNPKTIEIVIPTTLNRVVTPDGVVHEVNVGSAYVIVENNPELLFESTVPREEAEKIFDLIQHSISNPVAEQIQKYFKTFLNVYFKKDSGFSFFIFKGKDGKLQNLQIGNTKIPASQILQNKELIINFIQNKKYNIDKAMLDNKAYEQLYIQSGQLKSKTTVSYREWIFQGDKFKVWGHKLPEDSSGNIIPEEMPKASGRLNKSINFSTEKPLDEVLPVKKSKNKKPTGNVPQKVEEKILEEITFDSNEENNQSKEEIKKERDELLKPLIEEKEQIEKEIEEIEKDTKGSEVNTQEIEDTKKEISNLRNEDGSISNSKILLFNSLSKKLRFLQKSFTNQVLALVDSFSQLNNLSEKDIRLLKRFVETTDFSFEEIIQELEKRNNAIYKRPEELSYFEDISTRTDKLNETQESIDENINERSKQVSKNLNIDLNKVYYANELDSFVQKYGNAQTKFIWSLIKNIADKLKIPTKFLLEGKNNNIAKGHQGEYSNGQVANRASLLSSPDVAARTIVHELVHGVTSYIISAVKNNRIDVLSKLTQKQINAAKKLSNLLKELQIDSNTKDFYGSKNEHEILAELTHDGFVEALKNKKLNFVERFLDYILDILGIPTNAYNEALSILKDMIENPVDYISEGFVYKGVYYSKGETTRLEQLKQRLVNINKKIDEINNKYYEKLKTLDSTPQEGNDVVGKEGVADNYPNWASKTYMEKRQQIINELPKKRLNYKEIKSAGVLSAVFKNPKILDSTVFKSAKGIYKDIMDGLPIRDTPYVDKNNNLLDGINRVNAQVAAGIENIEVAVINDAAYEYINKRMKELNEKNKISSAQSQPTPKAEVGKPTPQEGNDVVGNKKQPDISPNIDEDLDNLKIENTSEQPIDEKEKAWFSNAFYNGVITPVFGLIDDLAVGKVVTGMKILVSNLAKAGTIYHEGFHLITNHLPKESKAAYSNLRKRLGNKVVRVQSGKTFVNKKGKDLTDREADEFLAYEFEDFMLNPDYEFPSEEHKTLFNKIADFLKRVLNSIGFNFDIHNPRAIEELFNYAKNANKIVLSNKSLENSSIYKIPGFKQGETKKVLSAFNKIFFRLLANPNGKTPGEIGYKEVPSAKDIFEAVDNLKGVFKKMEEFFKNSPENSPAKNIYNKLQINDTDYFKLHVEEYRKYLNSFGVKVFSEIEEDEDIETKDKMSGANDVGPGKKASEINPLSNIPDAIRILISSLPIIKNGKIDNLTNYNNILNILLNRLSNTDNLQDKLEILSELSTEYSELSYIPSVLNEDSKEGANLKLQFDQFFGKNKTNVVKTLLSAEEITVIDAVEEAGALKNYNEWKINSINSEYIETGIDGEFYIQTDKFKDNDLSDFEKVFDFFNGLGIIINPSTKTKIKSNLANFAILFTSAANIKQDLLIIKSKEKKVRAELLFDAKSLKSSNRLREVSNLVSMYEEENQNLNYRSSTGKINYLISLPTYISKIFNKIKKKKPIKFLEPYNDLTGKGNPMMNYSYWRKSLDELSVNQIKGMETSNEGNDIDTMEFTDYVVNSMNVAMSKKNKFVSTFNRPADRAVDYVLEGPTTGLGFSKQGFIQVMSEYAKGELLTDLLSYKSQWGKGFQFLGKHKKDSWEKGTFKFYNLSYLDGIVKISSIDKVFKKDSELSYLKITEELFAVHQNEIESKIGEIYDLLHKNLFNLLESKSLIRRINQNDYVINFVSKNLLENNLGIVSSTVGDEEGNSEIYYTKSQLDRVISHYLTEDIANRIEQTIFITGSPALYKNSSAYNKRTTLAAATRYYSTNEEADSLLDKFYPRTDGRVRTNSNEIRKTVTNDIKKSSNTLDFGNYAKDMNVSDAASWVTPDHYREEILRSNNWHWTKDIDRSWTHVAMKNLLFLVDKKNSKGEVVLTKNRFKEIFKEHLPDNFEFRKWSNSSTYYEKEVIDINTLLPLNGNKPQAFYQIKWANGATGNNTVLGDSLLTNSYKTANQIISIEALGENSAIMNWYIDAFSDQIDILTFESTAKNTLYPRQEVFKADVVNGDTNYAYIPYDYNLTPAINWDEYGIQQEIENKTKTKVVQSTQLRSQILINIKDLVKTNPELESLSEEFQELNNLRIKLLAEKLVNELGLGKDKDIDKLSERLKEAFESKDTSQNDIDGVILALSGDSKYKDFDSSINRVKIKNILYSLFRSDVIAKKIKGDAYIQVSVAATNFKLSSYIKLPDGTTAAEVAIQCPKDFQTHILRHFNSLDEFNDLLQNNPEKAYKYVDKNLLTFPANRIPCQGPNLIDVFKIKYLLPHHVGNMIIASEEHTTKTGSDFDVDKLLSYFNNFKRVGNKLVSLNYTKSLGREEIVNHFKSLDLKKEQFTDLLIRFENEGLDIEKWVNFTEINEDGVKTNLNDFYAIEEILREENIDSTDLFDYITNKDTVGVEEFVDKYLGKPSEDLYGVKVIENRINDIIKEIALHPAYFDQLMATTDEAAGLTKKAILGGAKKEAVIPEYWELVTPQFNWELSNKFFKQGDNIGIIANMTKGYIIRQLSPVKINTPGLLDVFSEANSTILGVNTVTNNGERISDIYSGLMTGFIDVGTDPFVLKAMFSDGFLNSFNLMLQMGNNEFKTASADIILKIATHPIIKEFAERITYKNSMYAGVIGDNTDTNQDIFESILLKYGIRDYIPSFKLARAIEDLRANNEEFTDDLNLLKENLNFKVDETFVKESLDIQNKDYSILSAKILDLVLYYKYYGDKLANLDRVTRPDSSFPKGDIGIKIVQELRDSILEEDIFDKNDVQNILSQTYIAEFDKVRSTALEAYSPFFLTGMKEVDENVRQFIREKLENNSSSDMEAELDFILSNFSNYVVQRLMKAWEIYPSLYLGENSLSSRIQDQKKKTENKDIEIFNTLFAKTKEYQKKYRTRIPINTIGALNKKMDGLIQDRNVDSIIELYESDNPELVQIANDIITYTITSVGTRYTPQSFQQIVPSQKYWEIVNPFIQEFREYFENAKNFESFWKDFNTELILNNPTKKGLIPQTSYRFKTKNGKSGVKPVFSERYKGKKGSQTEELINRGITKFGKTQFRVLSGKDSRHKLIGILNPINRGKITIATEPALWARIDDLYYEDPTYGIQYLYVRVNTSGVPDMQFEIREKGKNSYLANNNKGVSIESVIENNLLKINEDTNKELEVNNTFTENKFENENSSSKIVWNKEQIEAIEATKNFIDNGDPNSFYLIQGKAGTGKSSLIREVLKNYKNKSIIAGALSHKAKGVIKESINKENIPARFYSLAGMLGLKLNMESGNFEEDKENVGKEPPVSLADIIVIDEASMINEDALEILFSKKYSKAKIIFLGDIGQLPPIRTLDNPYYTKDNKSELFNKKSPVFDTKNKSMLITRVRQGEESPILPFADYFWNNSMSKSPVLQPANNRKSIISNNGSLIFTNQSKDIINETVELFKEAVFTGNPNLVKFITYKNNTREAINTHIHNAVFGNNSNQFNKGEIIIFNNSYGDIENATETQITNISDQLNDSKGFKYFKTEALIETEDGLLNKSFLVLNFEDRQKYKEYVNSLFKEAFSKKGTSNYRDLLTKAWDSTKKYADVDYGYAITSHKSQGSTYNVAIIHEQDILSVSPISNITKSESIYTALTRASNIAVVISATKVENSIIPNLKKLNYNINSNKTKANNSTTENKFEDTDNTVIISPDEMRKEFTGDNSEFSVNNIIKNNLILGKTILNKLNYKNENRLENGNVKGGQSGWKIRFNIKNQKTGLSYYDNNNPDTRDSDYKKNAEILINFLLNYFGSNQKADSKQLEQHYIIEDKEGNKREPFKHLSGGEVGESDFTIYLGSADDTLKFISDIRNNHPEIIKLLHSGNLSDDIKIDDIFKGRIEGSKIGFSGYHTPTNLYNITGKNEFLFVYDGKRVSIDYGSKHSLSDITIIVEDGNKGYKGIFDQNLKNDYPELYKNLRNIIGFQLYGSYLKGSNGEFLKLTNTKEQELSKGDINDKSKDNEIYEAVKERTIRAIKEGKSVVIDSTNLQKDRRRDFIKAINDEFGDKERQFTPENVTSLKPNQVFVFGSNAEGVHGKGAALLAKQKFGAIQGQSRGLQGQSYAVITKKHWNVEKSSTLQEIGKELQNMLIFAKEHPEKEFLVTKLGSSLAGYKVDEIKGLFKKLKNIIPDNVILPKEYEVRDFINAIKGAFGENELHETKLTLSELEKIFNVNTKEKISSIKIIDILKHLEKNDNLNYLQKQVVKDLLTKVKNENFLINRTEGRFKELTLESGIRGRQRAGSFKTQGKWQGIEYNPEYIDSNLLNTLFHELAHGIYQTDEILTQLEPIRLKAKEYYENNKKEYSLQTSYGVSATNEFLAESIGNTEFQKLLKDANLLEDTLKILKISNKSSNTPNINIQYKLFPLNPELAKQSSEFESEMKELGVKPFEDNGVSPKVIIQESSSKVELNTNLKSVESLWNKYSQKILAKDPKATLEDLKKLELDNGIKWLEDYLKKCY